jgi:hypothetical protein
LFDFGFLIEFKNNGYSILGKFLLNENLRKKFKYAIFLNYILGWGKSKWQRPW